MEDKSPLFQRTVVLVKAIPKGYVLSYGLVAKLISAPNSARYVSYILNSSSKKYQLPWYRVINSSGKVSSHSMSQVQIGKLRREGVEVVNNRVDFTIYTWKPTSSEVEKLLGHLPQHKIKF